MRLISDVHGKSEIHLRLARDAERSIQIGDCGFEYGYLAGLDPERHKILGGNHDNYPELVKQPHYLGDFGTHEGLFFVRGAWSIDQQYRVRGVSWWEEEEMTYARCQEAIDAYTAAEPSAVVSHDCPLSALEYIHPGRTIRTRTGCMLEQMLEVHQPGLWVFGHHHVDWSRTIKGCEFRCLIHEGGYLDLG